MIMMQGLDESSGYVPASIYQSHQVSPIFFVSSLINKSKNIF